MKSWPLYVHLVLIVGVCYLVALFLAVPQYAWKLVCHIVVLTVPAWYLGRAMAGAYDKREERP